MAENKSVLDNKYVKGAMILGTAFSLFQIGVIIAKSKPVANFMAGIRAKGGQ